MELLQATGPNFNIREALGPEMKDCFVGFSQRLYPFLWECQFVIADGINGSIVRKIFSSTYKTTPYLRGGREPIAVPLRNW